MQFPNEVKQALRELPPAERVVAIALKNIYEKVRSLYLQEKKEIDAGRQKFTEKFKNIESNACSIIKGRKIEQDQLANTDDYLVEEEKNDLKGVLDQSAPIKDYWLVAIKNSHLRQMVYDQDEGILANLSNISSTVTETTIQITLQFGGAVVNGSFSRHIELDGGAPLVYKGDQPTGITIPSKGLVFQLFNDTTKEQEVYCRLQLISFLINNLVPYSLRYFLGEIVDEDEDVEQDQDDQEQQGEQDEESQGRKKKQ